MIRSPKYIEHAKAAFPVYPRHMVKCSEIEAEFDIGTVINEAARLSRHESLLNAALHVKPRLEDVLLVVASETVIAALDEYRDAAMVAVVKRAVRLLDRATPLSPTPREMASVTAEQLRDREV